MAHSQQKENIEINTTTSLRKVIKWLKIWNYLLLVSFVSLSLLYLSLILKVTTVASIVALVYEVLFLIHGFIITPITLYYQSKFFNKENLFKFYIILQILFLISLLIIIILSVFHVISKFPIIISIVALGLIFIVFSFYTLFFTILLNYKFYKFTKEPLYLLGFILLFIFSPIGSIIMLIALKKIEKKFHL